MTELQYLRHIKIKEITVIINMVTTYYIYTLFTIYRYKRQFIL